MLEFSSALNSDDPLLIFHKLVHFVKLPYRMMAIASMKLVVMMMMMMMMGTMIDAM